MNFECRQIVSENSNPKIGNEPKATIGDIARKSWAMAGFVHCVTVLYEFRMNSSITLVTQSQNKVTVAPEYICR